MNQNIQGGIAAESLGSSAAFYVGADDSRMRYVRWTGATFATSWT
jgi:hypothetical protein